MKKTILGAAGALSLALPAVAGAHATVTPMQPQGKALTSARTLYVLRVPNERAETDTFRVTLFVPPAVQEGIRLQKRPGWRITLAKRDTGKTDGEGGKIFAVQKVTWTARRGQAIEPLFYDDFMLRFQNPATAQKMCFWVHQDYGTPRRGTFKRTETVKWTGPEGSETPASCVNFVAS